MKATALELAKAEAIRRGYRIEVDADGTERVIRPDGTVAVIARPPAAALARTKKKHAKPQCGG